MSRRFRVVENEGSFFYEVDLGEFDSETGELLHDHGDAFKAPDSTLLAYCQDLKKHGRLTPHDARVLIDSLIKRLGGGR